MDMKKILTIVSGKEQINEDCGMPPMGQTPAVPQTPPTPPMTMSVNMNANGVDQIRDLLDILSKQAMEPKMEPGPMTSPIEMPVAIEPVKTGVDDPMKQIKDLIGGPKEEPAFANSPDEKVASIDAVTKDAGGGVNGPKNAKDMRADSVSMYPDGAPKKEMEKVADEVQDMADTLADVNSGKKDEEYANEPDEKYGDVKMMTRDLAGGINREKKQYPKAQDGDNAMAVETLKQELEDLYRQVKEG